MLIEYLKSYIKNRACLLFISKKGISFYNMGFAYLKYFFSRYILRKEFNNFWLHDNAKIDLILPDSISFFGYYNLSPTNYQNDIIFCTTKNNENEPNQSKKLEIFVKTKNQNAKQVGSTESWNWQQGCMLQWLPPDYVDIIYNDYDMSANSYVSKVVNKKGQLKNTYGIPISNISKCGTYALAFNYDRLSEINPSYGYNCIKNYILPPDNKDGIWRLDLNSGLTTLILTIEDLKQLNYSKTMDGAIHKVNHIDINPSGYRFLFLHRWRGPSGRFHRLISADKDGKDLFILNGDRMVSHCCWFNDQAIISFCHFEGIGDGYYILTDKTKKRRLLSKKLPKEDGHPSVSPDGKWLVTDTYPNSDKARMSKLYLYNFERDILIELGRFFQPLRYKNYYRIDLHPKWALYGKSIFFESGHSGKRQLYQLDIKKIISL